MPHTHRLGVVVTVVNLLLLVVLWRQVSATSAQTDGVLRGRGLELVDASGRVRAQVSIEPDGEAVFRMRDASGTIRVKLAASADGSGLLLLDEATEPAVQILARRSSTSSRAATSINLTGPDGKRRTITP